MKTQEERKAQLSEIVIEHLTALGNAIVEATSQFIEEGDDPVVTITEVGVDFNTLSKDENSQVEIKFGMYGKKGIEQEKS